MKIFTLPNLMTCGNLLCGCFGIIFCFQGNLSMASYCIFLSAVFDFLDGFVARLTNSASPIGKELDSLADVVSFGVLPAIIIFHLLLKTGLEINYAYLSLIIAVFSALRLAKFNVDTRQSDSFIGVPTPANAIAVAAFPLILQYQETYQNIILDKAFLLTYIFVMSYLLISEIPLFALKFKNFTWTNNKIQYGFLIVSLTLLFILKFVAIPLIVLLYIVLSITNNFQKKIQK